MLQVNRAWERVFGVGECVKCGLRVYSVRQNEDIILLLMNIRPYSFPSSFLCATNFCSNLYKSNAVCYPFHSRGLGKHPGRSIASREGAGRASVFFLIILPREAKSVSMQIPYGGPERPPIKVPFQKRYPSVTHILLQSIPQNFFPEPQIWNLIFIF